MSAHELPLAEVIAALRDEIREAAAVGKAESVRFGLGPIEVEFNVTAKREGEGKGSIKFGVLGVGFEAGASGKIASEQVQKVKLTLKPSASTGHGTKEEIEVSRVPRRRTRRG